MTDTTLSMSMFTTKADYNKAHAKRFIDANVWDGEDRAGCKNDWAKFSPDDLQELVDELLDHLCV